jgi:hypothetical protein
MKLSWRTPCFVLGIVVLWRVALLFFTGQPIPANDAYIFDGGMINWLQHGHYVNPCIEVGYPISSGQVFSIYPPIYQIALLLWMPVFGFSTMSIIAMHVTLFAVAACLVLALTRKFFPGETNYAVIALLLFGITFNDRPEDLAHIFGLTSLWLVTRQLSQPRPHLRRNAVGLTLALLLTLYTSVIVGAFYFGAGFLTGAAAWFSQPKNGRTELALRVFSPFFAAALLFFAGVGLVIETHPLWWQGFLENGRKQSVMGGFHLPHQLELIKLIRTTPVFLVALGALPLVMARRRQLTAAPWLCLVAGVFTMGIALLFLTMTLIAPDYVNYVIYAQILLAAGLLALTGKLFPTHQRCVRLLLLGCVLLVSIRALGMTTWGAACAWKNSYWHSQAQLRAELKPFADSNAPVVLSSAFLYGAAQLGVRHPIHSDWYYDRALTSPTADFEGIVKLHPSKLVLTQFDYYRAFIPLLAKLQQHPELVTIRVRDESAVRTPDASPKLQRVVQHISWAPVIVDLDWKN